jgi:5-methylcytosine-specific restriction endonuclease McrA
MSKKKKKAKGPAQPQPKNPPCTESTIQRVYRRENGQCYWCRRKVTIGIAGKGQATKDHVLPKSKGGTSAIHNIVLSCYQCNSGKSNHLVNPATNQVISPEVLWAFLKEV